MVEGLKVGVQLGNRVVVLKEGKNVGRTVGEHVGVAVEQMVFADNVHAATTY